MHVSTEGNLVRHTLYLCAAYGPKLWEELNIRVRQVTRDYMTLLTLDGLVDLVSSRQHGSVLKLTGCYTAEHIECWLQVSPFCLLGLITPEDFDCWMEHMHAERQLWASTFDKHRLDNLQMDVDHWRYSLKNTLCLKADGQQEDDGMTDSNDHSDPEDGDAGDDGSQVLTSGFTSCYPNFEAESHWADQIRFLGPVWFQDTKVPPPNVTYATNPYHVVAI